MRGRNSGSDDEFENQPLIDGARGIDHNPYGYRGYAGPDKDEHNARIKGDEKQRIEWDQIKVQVFRLQNGVILQAHSEVEAGAYRNKGAVLVDTVYKDD